MSLEITEVSKESTAEQAGIMVDDVLISYDGIDSFYSINSLIEVVEQAKDRQEDIEIVIKRNGITKYLKAKPGKLGVSGLYSPSNVSSNLPSNVSSHYSAGQTIASLAAFLGWLLVLLSVFLLMLSIGERIELVALSVFGIVSGLFLVMSAQATRAVMDNADHSRLILKELKNSK